jgi:hypothetical protein
MDLDETITCLTKEWGGKTLAAFRAEAVQEPSGISHELLRIEGGSREIIVVCLTGQSQMEMLGKVMDLSGDAPRGDWNSLTLCDLAVRTMKAQGLSHEDLRDASGQRIAVALCATSPEMVGLVERLFRL